MSVEYDARGRPRRRAGYAEFGAWARQWLYAYDERGRLASLTVIREDADLSELGRTVHRFEYEDERVAHCRTDGTGARVDYERDASGRLTARTLRRGDATLERWAYEYCGGRELE